MIKLRGIDHLVLRVVDVEKMIDFYTRILGCRLEWRRPEYGLTHLRIGPSTMLDLVDVASDAGRKGGPPAGREARNVDHFCLQVEALDVDATVGWLKAQGIEVGEVRSRYGAEGRSMTIYLNDPEGNTVELKGPATERPRDAGEPNPSNVA